MRRDMRKVIQIINEIKKCRNENTMNENTMKEIWKKHVYPIMPEFRNLCRKIEMERLLINLFKKMGGM